jgi:SAM-dependent methyltransferase
MNRQRALTGGNSYAKELGFNPVDFLQQRLGQQESVAWADLCCGSGRAMIQAAQLCHEYGLKDRMSLLGIDLVPMFDPVPTNCCFLTLEASSVTNWQPNQQFDLITCVHGLHYVGDKLGIIYRVSKWLKRGGLFVAHLDYANLRLQDSRSARVRIGKDLRKAGFHYHSRRHLLLCEGPIDPHLSYRYLGADPGAGPNCTGQPAVDSYYNPG